MGIYAEYVVRLGSNVDDVLMIGRVYYLWVAPGMRRRGLGTKLLKMLEREAVKMGCEIMRLEVNPKNEVAMHLYERHGYRKIRRLKRYYANGANALRLEKRLYAKGYP